MTLGNVVGPASATASIANGKSVSFSATASPGIVAQLNFRAPPPNGTPGALLAPPIQVELRDAAGNLTAAANPVTVSFGTNPGNATLGGTLTRTSAAGVASFNDLTVSAAGERIHARGDQRGRSAGDERAVQHHRRTDGRRSVPVGHHLPAGGDAVQWNSARGSSR